MTTEIDPDNIDPEQVAEHVNDIMFDSLSMAEPDCLLCIAAVKLGYWAELGVSNPFESEDE